MVAQFDEPQLQELLPKIESTTGVNIEVAVPFPASTQSTCYKITDRKHGESWVLKVFNQKYPHINQESFSREVETLRSFHSALNASHTSASCPAPIAVFNDEMAYLMSYFPGRLIHELSEDDERFSRQRLAHTIVEAMKVFYSNVGPLYGDFHHDNILIDDAGTVCLIDPTHANPYYRRFSSAEYREGTADMGFWISSTCVHAVRRSVMTPGQVLKRLRFTALLLDIWKTEMGAVDELGYVSELFTVSDVLLARVRGNSRVRGPVLYVLSKLIEACLRSGFCRKRLLRPG